MNVSQVAQLNPSLLLPHLLPAAAASGAASALLNPAMAQLPSTQASRQARRLYVGNIPPNVSDVSHIAICRFPPLILTFLLYNIRTNLLHIVLHWHLCLEFYLPHNNLQGLLIIYVNRFYACHAVPINFLPISTHNPLLLFVVVSLAQSVCKRGLYKATNMLTTNSDN